MKWIKSFPTTSALADFLDTAESGYYLLRDESDTGATRIHYERVNNLPYLCIRAISASTVTFTSYDGSGSAGAYITNLQYSVDYGSTWTNFTGQTITLNAEDRVYWKRTVSTVYNRPVGKFILTGNVEARGNVCSLLSNDYENLTDVSGWGGSSGIFRTLFISQSALTKIDKLILQPTVIGVSGYQSMFSWCQNITGAAPTLNVSVVSEDGFRQMFNMCGGVNKVISYATNANASNLYDWLGGTSATGDFYNLGGAEYSRSTSGIPSGWTIHTSLDE